MAGQGARPRQVGSERGEVEGQRVGLRDDDVSVGGKRVLEHRHQVPVERDGMQLEAQPDGLDQVGLVVDDEQAEMRGSGLEVSVGRSAAAATTARRMSTQKSLRRGSSGGRRR